MTRTLILLRHGRTAWNAVGRAQGHEDIGLDDVGLTQARTVAPLIAALNPSALWSSDLSRASQTADEIARVTGLSVHTDERLREYDVGERSGLTIPEFAAAFPAGHAAWMAAGGAFENADTVPGSESSLAVVNRVVPALEEALASVDSGGTVCVVGHGAASKVALVALLGWDQSLARSLRGMDNCAWASVADARPSGDLRLTAYNQQAPDFASVGRLG